MAAGAVQVAPRRRGRPPRISPSAILDAVNAKHDNAWTMASIAAELGVSEPTIYYYFPTKDALLAALGERVMAEFPLPEPRDDWADWLEELAVDLVKLGVRHPFLQDAEMTLGATDGPDSLRLYNQLLDYLISRGFDASSATLALSAVLMITQQLAGALAKVGPESTASAEERVDQAKQLGLPSVVQAYTDMASIPEETYIRTMVRVVISGIQRELAPDQGRRRRLGSR